MTVQYRPGADDSRGITPDSFKANSRWLTGPTHSQLSAVQVFNASLNQDPDPDPDPDHSLLVHLTISIHLLNHDFFVIYESKS
jgi:hypothetical protein